MIETKVESQNYLADPYNSLGHIPFGTDQYVISAINFLFSSPPRLSFSFRLRVNLSPVK